MFCAELSVLGFPLFLFGVEFIVIIVFKTPFDALLLLCDICGLLFGLG